MASKIRKGDTVQVMGGRDRDQRGRVVRVDSTKNRVWVEKVNMISRHRKGVAGQTESTIEKKEASLHLSNVMLVDPELDVPTRVGFRFVSDVSDDEQKRLEAEGQSVPMRKVRFAKRSNADLD
ncbi:MAG: 50S ribosomal protein L24 [Planctomycetales bacterium]|nr:50S ribosomal protein L24 [Planctomycetales bacterium]